MLFALIAVFFCIIGAAMSSGLETAFISLDRLKLHHLINNQDKKSLVVQNLLSDMEKLLAATLIVTNVFLVAAASLAQIVASYLCSPPLQHYAALITTVIMTPILVIFAEIVPKALFRQYADRLVLRFVRPISWAFVVLKPFVIALGILTDTLAHFLGVKKTGANPFVTVEELRFLVKMGESDGVLDESERKIIHSIFDFHGKAVKEIMTPRVDVISIEINSSLPEVIQEMTRSGHSRLPVYQEKIDNIKGIIYEKDLIYADLQGKTLVDLIREPHFVPETKPIDRVFNEMQDAKLHMVVIIDEYGGFSGLVTIEDILEELVGEIQDEYDNEDALFTKVDSNTWIIDAMIGVETANEYLGLDIPEGDGYDTVGGYIFHVLGHIPKENETISLKNMRLTVCKADTHRIYSVKLTLMKKAEE